MHSNWTEIQQGIWNCSLCKDIERVELNIRQQTDLPFLPVKLLIVGIAPPFMPNINERTKAKSATNDAEDALRLFLEDNLGSSWNDLKAHGLSVLHAVKCAIRPKDRHQNPSNTVVNKCAPLHFYREFMEIKPKTVLTFGGQARRGAMKMLSCKPPPGLKVTGPLSGNYDLEVNGHTFRLFVAPFFLYDAVRARSTLNDAAKYAGLT